MIRRTLFLLIPALMLASVLALFLHYRHTGLTPHRYVNLVIATIDAEGSPRRQWAAAMVRRLTTESGLISDPVEEFPPDLQMSLPVWRGSGANALREPVRPRYLPDGQPIAMADINRWMLHEPEETETARTVTVDSADALARTVAEAGPGTKIVLAPGDYTIDAPLTLAASGSARNPLQLTASRLGEAVLTFRDNGSLRVTGPYWTVSDLVMRGECGAGACSGPVELGELADHFTVRNLFVTGAEKLLVSGPGGTPGTMPLAEGITMLNGELAAAGLSVRESHLRVISRATSENRLVILCPTTTASVECDTTSLREAAGRVAPDGLILLRRGDYRQAAHFRTPDVHLLAEPGARLLESATEGKGALVVSGDITVEGLECSGITVPDGNGACLRQNRGDVTLLGVHFHHSQMAVLTGHQGGTISIYDSYFHDNGRGSELPGQNHNIYVNSGRLNFVRSWSLTARNAGHEVKSRASHSRLEDCLIASVNARDSRLVDVPDGGVLDISGCVLGEGPRSENQDMIGYGLEIRDGVPPHDENRVHLAGNTFYSDRPQGAKLLNAMNASDITARNNMAVGLRQPGNLASFHPDRDAAGVPPFPALPALVFR